MARERTLAVRVRAAAPPERVWALLADARGWRRWTRFSVSELEREGDPPPDGVGAIRRFGGGRVVSREEVVAFDPPSHLSYVILSGMPVRRYRADVTLEPDGGGTLLTWSARFEPRIAGTGPVLRAFFTLVLRDFARRLARAASSAPP